MIMIMIMIIMNAANPCAEISLRNKQMCNLTEVNGHACETPRQFLDAVESATVIGTLQAGVSFLFIKYVVLSFMVVYVLPIFAT
jgi:hypothetical protein